MIKRFSILLLIFTSICAQPKRPQIKDYPRENLCDTRQILVDSNYIHVWQGIDECTQYQSIKIPYAKYWDRNMHQLDDDEIPEYVVISRTESQGSYYKLQIIDFPSDRSISCWTFDSYGPPEIKGKDILIGNPKPNAKTSHDIEYKTFHFLPSKGLVEIKE